MADTAAVGRLRSILAATMAGNEIQALILDVAEEVAGQHVLGDEGRSCRSVALLEAAVALREQRLPYAAPYATGWLDAAKHLEAMAEPELARCCMCGSADVRYRNYQEKPFCWPCADGTSPQAREQIAASLAEPASAPEVTITFNADTPRVAEAVREVRRAGGLPLRRRGV